MRLHSLQITAFGPFAATETVDFDALGADGLFLLHGETGAGKTTVLDAVAFALFGRVPGARSEVKRLLSDHAGPDARPQVRLELTVGGRRLRLVRSPAYERRKRRGTGTVDEKASGSLTWVDEPGSDGITRLEDIGAVVSQLLGMSAEQFFQVVLLPQGEFARFLRASTEERATVLKRLFGTGRFGDVEAWFREQRKHSAERVKQGGAAQTVLLGKLATAAGVDDHRADDGAEPMSWAASLVTAAEIEQAKHEQALAVAGTAASMARAELDAATRRSSLLQRRRRAQQAIAVLAADRSRRVACEQELAAARGAEPVATAAADAEDAQRMAAENSGVLQQLVVAVQADPDGARGLAAELDVAVAGWRSEIGSLGELAELADRSETELTELAALRQATACTIASLADLDGQRSALPVEVESAEALLGQARRAGESLPMLAVEHDRAADAARAGAELVAARAQALEADRAEEAATCAHLQAKQHWLDLRERRLDGMAAELARDLQRQAPCPVCGCTEHPAPATGDAEHVGRTQEVAALEVEQRAAESVECAGVQVQQLARAVDALAVRSRGEQPEILRAEEVAASGAHADAQVLAQQLDTASQQVRQLREVGEELDAQARTQRSTVAASSERIRSLQERITVAQLRLSEACGADPDVYARRDRLRRLAAAGDALLAARSAADGTAAHAADRQARTGRAAAEAGFVDVAAALGAVRSPSAVQELQSVLDAARNAEAAACAVLEEPEVAATADTEVDLTAAQTACAAADAVLGEAQGNAADAIRKSTDVRRLRGELAALSAVQGPELAKHVELTALADVINGLGQNSRRMSLHSYVLAARLEEVAEVASVRLRRMSGDRYEFVHSDAPEARGTRGGLGLDIRDDYTGAVRSAKTLSGGESFLASLALALGLADVVAAESGGVLLDTLFIDEGFGSLDAGTLEEVMAVLDDLRAGGRVVGLVSHVDELRQRIPNRLLVHKGRGGSHLELSSN